MAIKVGGTEVVDNNRQLKNIASVDATTVAALGTAGVGSGGGKFSATADGAIAIGKPVILQSNGTVKQVVTTVNELGTPTVSSDVNIHANTNNGFGNTHYFPTANVYLYMTGIGSSIYAWTFSFNHSTNALGNFVTNGTTVDTGNFSQNLRTAFDPVTGKFMAAWNYNNSVRYRTGILSSSGAITLNSNGSANHATIASGDRTFDVAFSTTDNMFVLVYTSSSGGNGTVRGFTVDSSGVSTAVNVNRGLWSSINLSMMDLAYDSDNNRFMVAGRDNTNNDKGKAFYFSYPTSGALTLHDTTAFENIANTNIQHVNLAYNPEYNRFAVIYSKTGSGNNVQLLTVSGTSISAGGSVQQIISTNPQSARQIVYDPLTHKMVTLFITSGGTAAKIIDVSSTVASVGTIFYIDSNTNYQESHLVFNSADNVFAALYWSGSYTKLHTLTTAQTSSNNTSWIGFAESAISDTASGDILVVGSTAENQSGLTIGSTYYVQQDGTLATGSSNAVKAGRAIAANKLLITEGNA